MIENTENFEKNLIEDLKQFTNSLKADDRLVICSHDYKLSDSMAEFEALDPRTDIYTLLPKFGSAVELTASFLTNYKSKESDVCHFADQLIARVVLFIKGQPLTPLFFTCAQMHSPEYFLNHDSLEFAFLGGSLFLAQKILALAEKSGFRNHDDISLAGFPIVKAFDEQTVKNSLRQFEERFKSGCLKSSSKLTSKKIGRK